MLRKMEWEICGKEVGVDGVWVFGVCWVEMLER